MRVEGVHHPVHRADVVRGYRYRRVPVHRRCRHVMYGAIRRLCLLLCVECGQYVDLANIYPPEARGIDGRLSARCFRRLLHSKRSRAVPCHGGRCRHRRRGVRGRRSLGGGAVLGRAGLGRSTAAGLFPRDRGRHTGAPALAGRWVRTQAERPARLPHGDHEALVGMVALGGAVPADTRLASRLGSALGFTEGRCGVSVYRDRDAGRKTESQGKGTLGDVWVRGYSQVS